MTPVNITREMVANNPNYQFAVTSDKFLEGLVDDYSWTNPFLKFRSTMLDTPKYEVSCLSKLREMGQPCTLTAQKYRGCLLGLAIGDALGASNEFKTRGTFEPIRSIVGGGPFNLKPGVWTDDTSMGYALGQSLLHCGGCDPKDQMNKYLAWYHHGSFSPTKECFDIGNTVLEALSAYEHTGNPIAGKTDSQSAGNGSLMRIAPIPLYYANDPKKAIEMAALSSRTTHQAPEAVDSCRYYTGLIMGAMNGASKTDLLKNYEPLPNAFEQPLSPKVQEIREGDFIHKPLDEIGSTGYVITSMEAALWAFHNTDSFQEGALVCANMGGDSDTIAAIYGTLAGAYYGEQGLPPEWVGKIDHYKVFYKQAHDLLKSRPPKP